MTAEPERRLSPAEYLELERAAEIRSEYLDGEVFAMAGASRRHARIAWNLTEALGPQLRAKGCEGFGSDMRVFVPATGLYTYPDLSAVCGEPRFQDAAFDTLLNPILLVEVLSPSTEDYDRGRKFAHYRTIPELQAYLLLAQDGVHAELYLRQADGRWILDETSDPSATLDLAPVGARLPLGPVYTGVDLPARIS